MFFLGKAGVFVYLIMGLVVLFPMSTDPLRKIPASRLELWPLTTRERWVLRALSPWVNPVTWGLAAAAVWAARGKLTVGLWALVAGVFVAGFLALGVAGGARTRALAERPPIPGRSQSAHSQKHPRDSVDPRRVRRAPAERRGNMLADLRVRAAPRGVPRDEPAGIAGAFQLHAMPVRAGWRWRTLALWAAASSRLATSGRQGRRVSDGGVRAGRFRSRRRPGSARP